MRVARIANISQHYGSTVALDEVSLEFPAGVIDAGLDRLIDFTWLPESRVFIGLFANGDFGGNLDRQLDSQLMTTFALDGGLGQAFDFGSWHGVGEFRP